jgi:hypothetical protein
LFFAVVHRLVPLPITVEGYAKAVRQAKDIFYLHLGSHVVATATAMQHLVSDKEVEQALSPALLTAHAALAPVSKHFLDAARKIKPAL